MTKLNRQDRADHLLRMDVDGVLKQAEAEKHHSHRKGGVYVQLKGELLNRVDRVQCREPEIGYIVKNMESTECTTEHTYPLL